MRREADVGSARARLKWLAPVVVVAWSTNAFASDTFPQAVDQHLMLSGASTVEAKIAPPDGCLLCHVSESGGDGTNNAFGAAMKRAGAVGTEPNTVGPALEGLKTEEPRAVDDITMGINPNDDPLALQGAPPQPEYGCSVGGPHEASEESWCAGLVVLALLAWRSGKMSGKKGAAR
jgi:hypothetical protein